MTPHIRSKHHKYGHFCVAWLTAAVLSSACSQTLDAGHNNVEVGPADTGSAGASQLPAGPWQTTGYLQEVSGVVPSLAIRDGSPLLGVSRDDEAGALYGWDGSAWQEAAPQVSFIDGSLTDPGVVRVAVTSDGRAVIAANERQAERVSAAVFVAGLGTGAGEWQLFGTGAVAGGLHSLDGVALQLDGGRPVLAYEDYFPDGETVPRVQRWNGSEWQDLGHPPSASDANRTSFTLSLALSPAGNIYLAWSDRTAGGSYVYSARHDGEWHDLGRLDAPGYDPCLMVTADSSVWLAYIAKESDGGETVVARRRAEARWLPVGEVISGTARPKHLACTALGSGELLLAWAEDAANGPLQVYGWDFEQWRAIGDSGQALVPTAPNDSVLHPALAVDGDRVWVAWKEAQRADATVTGPFKAAVAE